MSLFYIVSVIGIMVVSTFIVYSIISKKKTGNKLNQKSDKEHKLDETQIIFTMKNGEKKYNENLDDTISVMYLNQYFDTQENKELDETQIIFSMNNNILPKKITKIDNNERKLLIDDEILPILKPYSIIDDEIL